MTAIERQAVYQTQEFSTGWITAFGHNQPFKQGMLGGW